MTVEKKISPFIGSQFPQFYQEEGPNFIAFVKAYYQWMEQQGEVLYDARRYQEYTHIDTTIDRYIDLYRNQYAPGVPKELATNSKFFLKRVLDLYRAKGTPRAYEIFFRALFNVDVKLYRPGEDVLRLSAGEWTLPKYLEVGDSPILDNIEGTRIYGSGSGARATVESYIVKNVNNKVLNILNISNLQGQFDTGEFINIVGNTDISAAPLVIGSLISVSLTEGGADYKVGDVLDVVGKGGGGKARVTSIREENGKVKFNLINGGSGYTMNAHVSVTGGGGFGATFGIGGLVDRSIMSINTDIISDYVLTALDAANYNFPRVGVPDIEDIDTPLKDAFTIVDVEIGTIQFLNRIRPGDGYSSNPTVTVVEPLIKSLQLPDGRGGIKGDNAIITVEARVASGIATSIMVYDSGTGYEDGERVELFQSNNSTTLIGAAVVKNQGTSAGYWKDTKGFLSSDKYIQDSYYYQDFSYEMQVPLELDKYKQLLKDLVHPVGIALFGKYLLVDENATNTLSAQDSSFTQV